MFSIGLSLLVGCSEPQTFEDYFHKEIKENKAYSDDANYYYSRAKGLVLLEDSGVSFSETRAISFAKGEAPFDIKGPRGKAQHIYYALTLSPWIFLIFFV